MYDAQSFHPGTTTIQTNHLKKKTQLQWCDECMAISYHICTTKKTMVEKKVHHHLIF